MNLKEEVIMVKQRTNLPMHIDHTKLPPQALELEEAVIGAILIESSCIIEVADILTPVSFYKEQHQKIYKACLNLFNYNKPIDILTVPEELKKEYELEEVGGVAYITQLTMRIASSAHIEHHARIVQQKFMQRELIRISSDITNKAFDDSIDIEDLLNYSQSEINSIATNSVRKLARKIGDIGKERIQELVTISKKEDHITGLNCYEKINKITGGWQNGNLIILAARPGMGKTRFAQEFAKKAENKNTAVMIFSLEMMDRELYDRELSCKTGIENMHIRQANFTKQEWEEVEVAQVNIEKLNVYIDDTEGLTTNEFRVKSRKYKNDLNIGFIIVDYLQLMKSPAYKKFREQEIADISRTLKSVAKELDIPVMALSQLNRDVEKRVDKRPGLADLRESGAIEQDSDIVAFLHRPEEYEKSNPNPEHENLIEVILAKHRQGATGVIKLWKTKGFTDIYEYQSFEGGPTNIEPEIPY